MSEINKPRNYYAYYYILMFFLNNLVIIYLIANHIQYFSISAS